MSQILYTKNKEDYFKRLHDAKEEWLNRSCKEYSETFKRYFSDHNTLIERCHRCGHLHVAYTNLEHSKSMRHVASSYFVDATDLRNAIEVHLKFTERHEYRAWYGDGLDIIYPSYHAVITNVAV